jgi:aryl-alcohol dehydrogenase-like predicted oxidoreductase
VLEKTEKGRRTSERLQKSLEKDRARIVAYEGFCKELGHAPGKTGLAWLLAQPAVTAPIIGPRTLQQLEEADAALDLDLSGEPLKNLDRIFPGPGGAAPEAYAW